MSGKLRLNGATSGYIELKAEDVANNSTLTISNDGFGGGKVLQVVQTVKTDSVSESVANNTWEDIAGMSASITPATGSKVLVNFNVQGSADGGVYSSRVRLVRGSTAIAIGDADSNRVRGTTGIWTAYNYGNYQIWNQTMTFLDTTPSGDGSTAITYKLQWTDSYGRTLYLNRSAIHSDNTHGLTTISQITLTEIGA